MSAVVLAACVVGGDRGGVAWYWCSCSTSGSEMYSGFAVAVLVVLLLLLPLADEFFLRVAVVVRARLNVCMRLSVRVLLAEMLFDLTRVSLAMVL